VVDVALNEPVGIVLVEREDATVEGVTKSCWFILVVPLDSNALAGVIIVAAFATVSLSKDTCTSSVVAGRIDKDDCPRRVERLFRSFSLEIDVSSLLHWEWSSSPCSDACSGCRSGEDIIL
jgi:hypothetical protein